MSAKRKISTPSEFMNYLRVECPRAALTDMPFFHNVAALRVSDIMQSGVLAPSKRKKSKNSVLYLFYGRPAFKPDSQEYYRGDALFQPISIILKPNCPLTIKAIYPFDTGAYENGLYKNYIPTRDLPLNRFALGNQHDISKQLVQLFFGSNKNYFQGNINHNNPDPYTYPAVAAFSNMIQAKGKIDFDDRAYTVEYQIISEIKLRGNIIGVAAEDSFFNNTDYRHKIENKWQRKCIPYNTLGLITSYGAHGIMHENIGSYLETESYI